LYGALGWPVPPLRQPSQLELHLSNGSRIVSLPESEEGIRCFSRVKLLVIDEAARVSDSLYRAVRPMLAVVRGRLLCLSTPAGRRGFFYEAWSGQSKWHRVEVTAHHCPRIPKEFLAEEQRELGERWFRQEYLCSFEEVVGSLFSEESIRAACVDVEGWAL
jgi:hypothetical protein